MNEQTNVSESVDQWERLTRLVRIATGEEYGDGIVVLNMGKGIADNGPDDDTIWIAGDWNNKTKYDRETNTRTVIDNTPERLGDLIEKYCPDVELEWYDQVDECVSCYKMLRTEPTSYFWQPRYLVSTDGYVCEHCAVEYFEDQLGEDDGNYIGNVDKALFAWAIPALKSVGFSHFNGTLQHGWHKGMDDRPADVVEKLSREPDIDMDRIEWVFVISETSQFYIEFQLWTRELETG